MSIPKVKKTRLTTHMRDRLKNHAKGLIRCPAEAEAVHATKKVLTDITDALAAERFPRRDMVVLEKYLMGRTVGHLEARVEGTTGSANCQHLDMSRPWHFPHNNSYGSCHFAVELPREHVVWGAYSAYSTACRALRDMRTAKIKDYNTLIDSCRNYEDLLEVWPEAEALRETLRIPAPNAISTLSDDVMARIQADVATRAGAAASLPADPTVDDSL